jgi:hypothetical protein
VTTSGPRICPALYPVVSTATARGNRKCARIASAIDAIPMNVTPNRNAGTSAAGTPPTTAGSAIPAAWMTSAASSRLGRDHRRLSHAHSAGAGSAASPASTRAPLPVQPGFPCSIAAIRDVPAMMYPTPSSE